MPLQPRFQCVDAAVIRASAFASRLDLPAWPDLTGDTPAHVVEWRSWLQRVWENEALAEAIEIASPTLATRVQDICDGRVQQSRRVRRAVESTIRYVLRAVGRATPFGLFAGVSPLHIGTAATLEWGEQHRATARPDAAWLTEVITQLEARHDVLRRLPVVANNLAFERGDRLVVPCRLHPGIPGEVRPVDVTVRRTEAVQTVMRAARSPITIDALAGILAAEFPQASLLRIEKMLAELVAHRILITSLHPPMDVTDPLGHLIERLATIGNDGILPTTVQRLQVISDKLSQHNQTISPGKRRTLRASVMRRMAAICDHPAPSLAVDLRLGCSATLPPDVVREAEAAAAALVRLTPHPFGPPAWQTYHARFLERWGIGAVVPLAEVIDADVGLGYPVGYRGSSMKLTSPPFTARDRILSHLAQRAALDGGDVILDEATLAGLAADFDQLRPPHAPPHTELRFILHAPTTDAINRGTFTLIVTSAARQAGTSAGRFLHLLDPEDRDRMGCALAGLPPLVEDAVLAQASCPPLSPRAHNLTRTPALFPMISIGEHRSEGGAGIPLSDLAVSGDAHHLFLVCLSQGHLVEPIMVNALEFRRATHPLARFLCEIATARAAACVPFAWGAARTLPFLPRVRYRRTLLSPATWNLSAADLPGSRTSWPQWARAWGKHCRTHRIPDAVFLGEADVRLRLDLTEPAHLAVLRTHLDRDGIATLAEVPDRHAYGWAGGHAHEIALPLAATHTSLPSPAITAARPIRSVHHPGHAPGISRWLYARLYVHPDRQSDILIDHLPALLSDWQEGPSESWWFLRHHDPEPHLRLRLPLHNAHAYGSATQHLGAWAERVRRLGLLRNVVFDTYYPETGRYGTGPTLDAAEVLFAADSAAVLAQLAMTVSGIPHPSAVTAASFIDLTTAFTGSLGTGLTWLTEHVHRHPAPPIDRNLHDQAMRLADPSGDWAVLRALPGGDQVGPAWQRRRAVLVTYHAHLTTAPGIDPDSVLASLLHLHHARMAGINHDGERLCLRLARAAAIGWAHRTKRRKASTTAMPKPPRR